MSVFNLLALSFSEIIGDFQLKYYAKEKNLQYLFGGIAGYAGVIFFLVRALIQKSNILYVNAMWDGISAIMESVAAFVILGERLDSTQQYMGLSFIILGLFLLKFKN